MFDQMKPICAIYVLHSWQGQSLGDQDLMKCLSLVSDPQCFIWSGIRSQIQEQDLIDWIP